LVALVLPRNTLTFNYFIKALDRSAQMYLQLPITKKNNKLLYAQSQAQSNLLANGADAELQELKKLMEIYVQTFLL